jgi:hypothetical protein
MRMKVFDPTAEKRNIDKEVLESFYFSKCPIQAFDFICLLLGITIRSKDSTNGE